MGKWSHQKSIRTGIYLSCVKYHRCGSSTKHLQHAIFTIFLDRNSSRVYMICTWREATCSRSPMNERLNFYGIRWVKYGICKKGWSSMIKNRSIMQLKMEWGLHTCIHFTTQARKEATQSNLTSITTLTARTTHNKQKKRKEKWKGNILWKEREMEKSDEGEGEFPSLEKALDGLEEVWRWRRKGGRRLEVERVGGEKNIRSKNGGKVAFIKSGRPAEAWRWPREPISSCRPTYHQLDV